MPGAHMGAFPFMGFTTILFFIADRELFVR